jgi:hypothetical protein
MSLTTEALLVWPGFMVTFETSAASTIGIKKINVVQMSKRMFWIIIIFGTVINLYHLFNSFSTSPTRCNDPVTRTCKPAISIMISGLA